MENLGRENKKVLALIESKFPLQTVLIASPSSHFKVTLTHHNMTFAWVADGRDGLQVWRIDANVLNKHSWVTHKG